MQIKATLTLLLSLCLFACTPNINSLDGKKIEVTGTIKSTGNTPFSQLSILGPKNKNILLIPKNIDQRIWLVKSMGSIQTLHGILSIIESKNEDGKIRKLDYHLYVEE